ncbi:S8 family serine peptidase [Bacillus cereus]|uniref:S8 family serine peptidase n=1 Tax=Bacillus cereus TaxID=1396 RepID=UPI000BFB4CF3|nr:S8 family serine peptidase [Bacillus cereus]PGT18969.1 hypothetical protein COC96_09750 [Bacillus cereus]
MTGFVDLLVGLNPSISKKERDYLHEEIGGEVKNQFPEINVDVVTVHETNVAQAIKDYQSSKVVVFVEKDHIISADFSPNDPFYRTPTQTSNDGLQNQWGLRRVNPEKAWDRARNIQGSVTVAILDSGIDPNHPDLAAKIVSPTNFTNNNPNDFIDQHGHGTHVAGIAAGITNNRTGIAGMSFNTANIMPVRVLDANNLGRITWFIAGVLYATNNGANVINMSLGGAFYSNTFQLAINFAWQQGIIIVAAAGNRGNDQVQYPAGYNFVLAVSATNQANDRASFSSWGMNVGIAAPGTAILSTTPTYNTGNNLLNYDALAGTSMATPFVSGLAAMIFAIYPQLSNQEVIQIIQRAANPIDATIKEWNTFFGYGLLDASNAAKRTFGKSINRLTTGSRTTGRGPKGKRSSGEKLRTRLGSFYGQVVNQLGIPIAEARISARRQGSVASEYLTRTNVPIDLGILGTDGMFRLQNLPPGTYGLFVQLPGPGQVPVQLQTATITPGADLYVRLVV